MQEITNTERDQRNYGIDLLRVLSMCFVVVLHALGQGGVLAAVPDGTGASVSAHFLESLTYGAVDIFALISGYVSFSAVSKKTRLSSWLLLWLETAFYGLAVTLAFCLIRPDEVPLSRAKGMYLPLYNYIYWYFTAYTGLFVIRPLLDAGVRAASERCAKRVFIAIFCAFSVYEAFRPQFKLAGGYSFAWITLLYLMGATMRKCGIGARMRPLAALAAILVLSGVNCVWVVFPSLIPAALRGDSPLSYVSPTVLATAVCFVIGFAHLRIGKGMRAVIRFAAPGAFAVYLLNTHPLVWSMVLQDRFVPLAAKPAWAMLGGLLGFSLAFTAAALLVDKLRQLLVKLLRIRAAAEAVERLAEKCVDWVGERLS